MSGNDNKEKMVRRLKRMGLVPQDIPVRIIFHHSTAEVKWEALHAVTREHLLVGGTSGITEMVKHEWIIRKETRGDHSDWVFLDQGEPLPLSPPGGGLIPQFKTRRGRY
jgi:hypothetical protein